VSDEAQKKSLSSIEAFAGHRPTKRLGQNFLKDPRVISRIIEAFAPKPDETVIEIGPGTGALTPMLVERAARVIAVEFDKNLAPALSERFAQYTNFKLLHADALDTDFCAEILPAQTARLVANLPYNVSTAIFAAIDFAAKLSGRDGVDAPERGSRTNSGTGRIERKGLPVSSRRSLLRD